MTDFEVIVVDDCSSDGSLEIARDLAMVDSRLKPFQNDSNLGDYGNRNKAASLARGKYLKYVDSDDLLYPHSLQVMVDAMDRDTNVALALSHSLPEDDEPYPWILTPDESYRKHFLGRGCFGCGPTGAIIRREAFEELGGFRKEWGVLADLDLWLRMAAKWPVALLPPGLVWWRRHEGQEFSGNDAQLVYLRRGFELGLSSLKDESCPMAVAENMAAQSRLRQMHSRRLLALATKGKSPLLAWRLVRASGLSMLELLGGLRGYS
jgi:glycosyltransferase involved in cell wall biosynthesis